MNQGGKINVAASTPSLLINSQQQRMLNNVTPQPQQLTKPNLVISNAPKQYFKPHDLNLQAPPPPQITRNFTTTPTNLNTVERIFSANKANRIPQQNGVYLQQNIKPAAPPPPTPTQQQQTTVTPLELFQQSSIPIQTISNSNPSGTPRNQVSRPTSSVGIIPPPPVDFNNNDEINRQPKQQTWKTTVVPSSNSQNQTSSEHTLTKTNVNNTDIDKVNTNINNTLNKHINEDILQLQARDAYSITGSSNGSSEYPTNNQPNNQQTTVNFKNQVSPAPIVKQQQPLTVSKSPSPQQQPLTVSKSPSPQPQFVIKTQPIMVQQQQVMSAQQKQQVNGRTITPTTLNANLAFIEEDDSTDKLNKNINTNDLQSSESYNERDFRRKGIDGDDIDDESSTLSTSSSVQPRIKHQRPVRTHPNTNEKSKVLLKSVKTLEPDYGRVMVNGSVNNLNKQSVNNLPGTINNSGNNSVAKPVVNGVNAGRPPCRLNFYDKDSDTNTNSEISPMLAHGGMPSLQNNNNQFIGNAIIGISKTYPALMKGL